MIKTKELSMKKQKLTIKKTKKTAFRTMVVSVAGVMAITGALQFGRPDIAKADQYDEQIKAIQSQVDGYNAQAASLKAQADTLQNAIAELDAQKAVIQGQINLSQAKHDKLVQQINDTEQKISATKEVLAQTLADIYVNGDTSTLEMLASSNNIADYVDAQEYRDSVSDQIQGSIKEIKALKANLVSQQKDVDQVLADQNSQRDQLQAKTNEQANLLAQTQGSEQAYQALIGQANSNIENLRAQQRAANAAASRKYGGSVTAGSSGHGGYPSVWDNSAQDTVTDNWGMYNRECVSYVAWRVYNAYGNMPYWGGRGNANQWPSNARAAGIATGSTPKVGSAAVMSNGYYGHVAWVEAVNGNGTVRVSQYNWDLAGHYSEMTISASAFDTYIYFGG